MRRGFSGVQGPVKSKPAPPTPVSLRRDCIDANKNPAGLGLIEIIIECGESGYAPHHEP